MGHRISAIVLRGHVDERRAAEFGLHFVRLPHDLTLIPLDDEWTDRWAERLDLRGFVSKRPLLDARVVHHVVADVAEDSSHTFAVVETDYFGGNGDQAAAVYRGAECLMAAEVARRGPINRALKLLGVRRTWFRDEFDVVGLGAIRDFDDLFDDDSP